MISLLVTLTTALLVLQPAAPQVTQPSPSADLAPAGVYLRYTRALGQKSRYRMKLEARGAQISLGERLPVKWNAEVDLSEEVIALDGDGGLWLRVTGRFISTSDGSGVFASATTDSWPQVDVHVNGRGEVLAVSAPGSPQEMVVRERAFLALAAQPPAVILPEHEVQLGDEWRWERDGASQTNRLLSLTDGADSLLAHLSSSGAAPLALDESSPALGLTTHLAGAVTHKSQADLLVAHGLLQRNKGEMRLRTKSETTLDTQDGVKVFEMETDLSITFDVRLVDPGRRLP